MALSNLNNKVYKASLKELKVDSVNLNYPTTIIYGSMDFPDILFAGVNVNGKGYL